jgi:hypothetical protein
LSGRPMWTTLAAAGTCTAPAVSVLHQRSSTRRVRRKANPKSCSWTSSISTSRSEQSRHALGGETCIRLGWWRRWDWRRSKGKCSTSLLSCSSTRRRESCRVSVFGVLVSRARRTKRERREPRESVRPAGHMRQLASRHSFGYKGSSGAALILHVQNRYRYAPMESRCHNGHASASRNRYDLCTIHRKSSVSHR